MYTAFRRLEKDGFILSYWGGESQGGRWKYYRLTKLGVEQYEQNKTGWEFAKVILDQLIKGELTDENA